MGFFGKIFKGIGKFFKSIGKGIMKGFKAVGKFINKLGIFGQIGMALLMPGIANFALGSLSSLGSGFMSGLASKGWTTVAGKVVAAKGFGAGAARVAHAVLNTAVKAGSMIKGGVQSIADTTVGLIGDSVKMVGNTVGIGPGVSGAATRSFGDQLTQIGTNAANKLSSGWGDLVAKGRDITKVVGDTATGKYAPQYETFTEQPKPSLFSAKRDPRLVTKETIYDTAGRESYLKSPEHFVTTPEGKRAILTEAGYDPSVQAGFPVSEGRPLSAEYLPEGMPSALPPEETMGMLERGKQGWLDTYSKGDTLRRGTESFLTQTAMQKLNQVGAHEAPLAQYGGFPALADTRAIYFNTVGKVGHGQPIVPHGSSLELDPNMQAVSDMWGSEENFTNFMNPSQYQIRFA